MKQTYFLGIDAAKHKMRVALSARDEHVLFEKDLPVNAIGLRELLATLNRQVDDPRAAARAHRSHWCAPPKLVGRAHQSRLCRRGDQSLIARRLYTLQNSIRDNKSDPIDARGHVHNWFDFMVRSSWPIIAFA